MTDTEKQIFEIQQELAHLRRMGDLSALMTTLSQIENRVREMIDTHHRHFVDLSERIHKLAMLAQRNGWEID